MAIFELCNDEIKKVQETTLSQEGLKERDIVLFSGIADNSSFKTAAVSVGLKVNKHYEYTDHYRFGLSDIKEIMSGIEEGKVAFLTTLKDSARIDGIKESLPESFLSSLYILKTEISVIDGGDHWFEKIKRMLQYS